MPADLTTLALLLSDRDRLAEEQKIIADRLEAIDAQLKHEMGDEEEAVVDGVPVLTWRWQESSRLDQTLLKSRYPAIRAECTRVSRTRVFRRVQPKDQVVDSGPATSISTDAGF